MIEAAFIAGDWGTSKLRLFLCDAAGSALQSATGPGAADVRGEFAQILTSLTAAWRERHGPLPAVLCGMVGSSIGWISAPYVGCPAQPEKIVDACVALQDASVHIVPGLSCRNRYNAADFLRGEETQILGALKLAPSLRRGAQLLCLPGTHTKWAVLTEGSIGEFVSAPTGELFVLLCDHSVLVRNAGAIHVAPHTQAFIEGITRCNEFPQAPLLHRLFECRARQLSGEFTAPAAEEFLSGLLIASDVRGGLTLRHAVDPAPVCLIGARELTQRYARALEAHGCASHSIGGDEAALAGLAHVHQRLSQQAAA